MSTEMNEQQARTGTADRDAPAAEPPGRTWSSERLDLVGYLARLGVKARAPSREALDELHEAHVRTFTFDNIDVLLQQHPGVGVQAVGEKFVGRGRGGYCFEHSTILAAALERLGYDVRRRLARVGDPADGPRQGRTHLVVEVRVDGQRLLTDPGFGTSIVRSIPLADGAQDDYLGWPYRVRRAEGRTWALERQRASGWEVSHIMDELPVEPADVLIGHHYTSTSQNSHFRNGLVLSRYLPGRHVTVTQDTLTVRRPGRPTEHRPLGPEELTHWLRELDVPITDDETARLSARIAELRRGSRDRPVRPTLGPAGLPV